jgi:hypothetical protein
VAPIDSFLTVVEEQVVQALKSQQVHAGRRHWVVLLDEHGAEISEVGEDEIIIHEALASLVSGGALGAAYVTYMPPPDPRVLAQVLTTDPRDSDVRTARLAITSVDIELGPWERTV